MSEIALYEALKLIPNITDEQAKAAVVDVAKKEEVVTKDYLDARFARVEAVISNVRTELKYIRWFLGFLFATQLAIVGVLVALFRLIVA